MKALARLIANACEGDFSIEDAAGKLTSAELAQRGAELAQELNGLGATPSEPVILLVGNAAIDIVGFYAAWQAELVVIPLHESAPVEVVAEMQANTGARFVIRGGRADRMTTADVPRILPEDTALIIFTSGSTGRPKGVMLSHGRLEGKINVLDELLHFTTSDIVVVPLQLTFVFGIWISLLAMKARARLVLMPRFSVSSMDVLLRDGATVIGVVPTMLRTMDLASRPVANDLRNILIGGEPLLGTFADKISSAFPLATIHDLYGSTETGSCDFHSLAAINPGTIGRPTTAVAFRIVDDEEADCSGTSVGELRILTPFGMLGYFGDQNASEAAFDSQGYFRSGDLARKRSDGLVEIVGRKKEIISRGGVKISPLEIDNIFETHPDVTAALCGGVPDDRLGETVHLLVVIRDGAELDADRLLTWASQKLERSKLPNAIHCVDSLPLGRTGKADRSGVRRFLAGEHSPARLASPRTAGPSLV